MKNLLYISLFMAVALFSCEKDENIAVDDTEIKNPFEDEYRVKRIFGEDKVLGNIQQLFYYTDSNLDSVWVCDDNEDIALRDTLADIFVTLKDTDYSCYYSLNTYDLEPYLVEYYMEAFPDTYKKRLEKYEVTRAVYSKQISIDNVNKRITRERSTTYVERPYDEYNDPYYDYTSLTSQTFSNRYEYDSENRVIVSRSFVSTYDLEIDNNSFTSEIFKTEYSYDAEGRVVAANKYHSTYGDVEFDESWELVCSYELTYEGDVLVSVDSPEYTLKREGDVVTIFDNGKKFVYTLNADGYPVEITREDLYTVYIEYEKGDGNYSLLYGDTSKALLGTPIIK